MKQVGWVYALQALSRPSLDSGWCCRWCLCHAPAQSAMESWGGVNARQRFQPPPIRAPAPANVSARRSTEATTSGTRTRPFSGWPRSRSSSSPVASGDILPASSIVSPPELEASNIPPTISSTSRARHSASFLLSHHPFPRRLLYPTPFLARPRYTHRRKGPPQLRGGRDGPPQRDASSSRGSARGGVSARSPTRRRRPVHSQARAGEMRIQGPVRKAELLRQRATVRRQWRRYGSRCGAPEGARRPLR